MSLAPAEERALARIESQLCRSDLKLALMLKVFGRRPFRRKGPVRERISPWRPRPRRLPLLALALVVLALGVMWGIVLSNIGHPVSPRACDHAVVRLRPCPPGSAAAGHRRPAPGRGLPVIGPGK